MTHPSIRVLASIDILGCEAVKLVQGVPGTGLRLGSPMALAERLHALGASWLHVVDLDGAFTGRPSSCVLGFVKRAATELGMRIQLGGGLRSLEALEEAHAAGAERLVVGSAWLRDPGFLDEAASLAGRNGVAAAIEEGGDGLVRLHGWRSAKPLTAPEAAREAAERGVWILYTQVDREGTLAGPDTARARRLAEAAQGASGLQFSGGVSGRDDLAQLAVLGYTLAVVGMALHTWRLNPIGILA